MTTATDTLLKPGTYVVYLPDHARGDTTHPAAEYGYVEDTSDDMLHVKCRYWRRGTRELRTTANGEWTPRRNLISMAEMPPKQMGAGIIFATEHILPIMATTKTVTRRKRNLDQVNAAPDAWRLHDYDTERDGAGREGVWMANGKETIFIPCPYDTPSKKLWVREIYTTGTDGKVYYRASDSHPANAMKWGGAMFMPYAYHRIDLQLQEIWLERLHDITEDGAKAEGAYKASGIKSDLWRMPGHDKGYATATQAYFAAWDRLNPRHPHSINPWVWALYYTLL